MKRKGEKGERMTFGLKNGVQNSKRDSKRRKGEGKQKKDRRKVKKTRIMLERDWIPLCIQSPVHCIGIFSSTQI